VSPLVFTDVDETLIGCKSMFDFLDYYLAGRYGAAGRHRAGVVWADIRARAAAGVPRGETNRAYYRTLAGEPAGAVARWSERWFADRVRGRFYVRTTRAALREHLAGGAVLVLVSGSFPALLDPIARDVGAAHVLCTRPEIRAGTYTGEIVGSPMIGEGKRAAVRALLDRYPAVDPAGCFGYGDHVSDLPMLEEVGHPVMVGPDGRHTDLVRGVRG